MSDVVSGVKTLEQALGSSMLSDAIEIAFAPFEFWGKKIAEVAFQIKQTTDITKKAKKLQEDLDFQKQQLEQKKIRRVQRLSETVEGRAILKKEELLLKVMVDKQEIKKGQKILIDNTAAVSLMGVGAR